MQIRRGKRRAARNQGESEQTFIAIEFPTCGKRNVVEKSDNSGYE